MSHSNVIFNRKSITHVTYRGHFAEYQEYCYTSLIKPTNSKGSKKSKQKINSTNSKNSLGGYRPKATKKPLYRSKNIEDQYNRSLQRIKQFIFNNFLPELSTFVTLTFTDGLLARVSNLQECNSLFSSFTKALNRRYQDFRHVSVVGVQHDRGTLHYHMLCNLTGNLLAQLNSLWPHGCIHLRTVDDLNNCSLYMAKNVKDLFEHYSFSQMPSYYRTDFHSRNLNKPIIVNPMRVNATADIYNDACRLINDHKPYFKNTYTVQGDSLVVDLEQYYYDCSPLFPVLPANSKSRQKKPRKKRTSPKKTTRSRK